MGFMDDVSNGIKDSWQHVIVSITLPAIFGAFANSGLISSNYIFIFNLIPVALVAVFILSLREKGFIYLIFWIMGIVLLVQEGGLLRTGLITILDVIIDIVIPIAAIVIKFAWIRSNE